MKITVEYMCTVWKEVQIECTKEELEKYIKKAKEMNPASMYGLCEIMNKDLYEMETEQTEDSDEPLCVSKRYKNTVVMFDEEYGEIYTNGEIQNG